MVARLHHFYAFNYSQFASFNKFAQFAQYLRNLYTSILPSRIYTKGKGLTSLCLGAFFCSIALFASPQAALAGVMPTSPKIPALTSASTATLLAQRQPSEVSGSFVAAAVRRVGGAVVRIDTERTITRRSNPGFEDPFFRQFFGDEFFQPTPPQQQRLQGQGSGFIFDGAGLVLTNAHVVAEADRVTVTLKDGRNFEGKVQGVDPVTDLAVVKISGSDLPVAPLGDSEQVEVGDWAIAVGNPLGLDNTVTLGIVSTLRRSSAQAGIPDKRLAFIQTDAAINPGNSGGPLLNQNGEVIGINTAIRADAMGIGFAIPINKAKEISQILAAGKKVSHPFLGIELANLTPQIARENNQDPNAAFLLPEISGVLVIRVRPNTPAANGGLRRGDVITQIDNQPITTAEQVQNAVENSRIGQALSIRIRRGDQNTTLSVRPGEMENQS
ncbi:MAG: trypsin-like serine protease [Coleofasciculaceae cyanobacterium SM2_1_6]|nr:trypsin-like serine protease [Coleofasciculaceae cyanobacterium SM2_1_6]